MQCSKGAVSSWNPLQRGNSVKIRKDNQTSNPLRIHLLVWAYICELGKRISLPLGEVDCILCIFSSIDKSTLCKK